MVKKKNQKQNSDFILLFPNRENELGSSMGNGFFTQTEKISFGGGIPGSSPVAVRNFGKNLNVYIHLPLRLDFGNKKIS